MRDRGSEGQRVRGSDFQPSRLPTLQMGFTLIELLLVVTIIGMMFSVSLPISYSMYQRYQASLKAEKVLTLVSSMRIEAFLYGREKLIESKDGKMLIDGADPGGFNDIFIQIDKPIKFYRTGLTSGGEIKVYAYNNTFLIEIESPLGELTMKLA
jgi:prepilin-type N-terminal cleavage/methylation domain-containing protein